MSDRNGNIALFQYVRRVRALALLSMVAIVPLSGQDIHPWLAGSGGAIYYNGGNVGIGTTSPASTLDVNGGMSASSIKVTGAPASAFYRMNADTGYEWWNGSFTTYDGYWQVVRRKTADGSWTAPLTITNGGNVGIGTTAPSSVLHVLNAGAASQTGEEVLRLQSSAIGTTVGSGPRLVFSETSNTEIGRISTIGSPGAFDLSFSTYHSGLAERMRITGSGNVGIGTTTPTHKLSVNGTIRTKEVVVDTGWADYVFEPAYHVRPLSEINAYIQQHQRLPDMPSAEEVREKGVGVGEMQVKLLAKIEEITLHMIQMERQNQELQKRVAELESAVERNARAPEEERAR